MKIVIAGCGNVGYYLAKTLCERRHRVSVIDDSLDRCRLIGASAFGRKIEITCGDATAERVLRDAGAAGCDAFIAVTGQDQNNLTACMLAKELLCAGRTITRVNNPGNIRVFQQLGVDCVISSAARIADVIEQELDWTDIDAILTGKTEHTRVRQFLLAPGAKAAGKAVSALRLPAGTIIIIVLRADRAIIPNGSTVLAPGDELMVMGDAGELKNLEPLFYGEVRK
jgi:trk system potassium uptake protein TrkA